APSTQGPEPSTEPSRAGRVLAAPRSRGRGGGDSHRPPAGVPLTVPADLRWPAEACPDGPVHDGRRPRGRCQLASGARAVPGRAAYGTIRRCAALPHARVAPAMSAHSIRDGAWAPVPLLPDCPGGRPHHPAEPGTRPRVTTIGRPGDHAGRGLYQGSPWSTAP